MITPRLRHFVLLALAVSLPALASCASHPPAAEQPAVAAQSPEDAQHALVTSLQQMKTENAESQAKHLTTIQALHSGKCNEALTALGIAGLEPMAKKRAALRAFLYAQGLCLKKAPDVAVQLLLRDITAGSHLPQEYALLGSLYWRGVGVKQDKARAHELFRRAVLKLAPRLFTPPDKLLLSNDEAAGLQYWGLSKGTWVQQLSEPEIGPWDLPLPLKEQLAWLASVKRQGGKAVMNIAFKLRDGKDGFPKDPPLAFEWLQSAGYDFKYPPAYFPYAQWLRDDQLFAERQADRVFPLTQEDRKGEYIAANAALLDAAKQRDVRAEREILRLLEAGPDYKQRNWAIYYWLLRLKRHGEPISESQLNIAKAAVPLEDRRLIQDWDDRHAREGHPLEPLYTVLPWIH